ncbi:unnamed protein product [Gongylonema pulchrum]|uniref:GLOBIN domain-containing protein n=1 Tax=Gongylonema pulchrum TaxID=637853 RepID=A0A183DEB1_9BILA|nr:unnamed protein product [Gongylonema pulchrum]
MLMNQQQPMTVQTAVDKWAVVSAFGHTLVEHFEANDKLASMCSLLEYRSMLVQDSYTDFSKGFVAAAAAALAANHAIRDGLLQRTDTTADSCK